MRKATATQKHTARAQSCTTSPKTHEGVATQPSTQHHVTQKQRKLTVANARHRRQLLVGCNHVSPRLTGASRWYEPKRSRFWAKCQLKPCMRTLFPRHWDPTPRMHPTTCHWSGSQASLSCCFIFLARRARGCFSRGASSRLSGAWRAPTVVWPNRFQL